MRETIRFTLNGKPVVLDTDSRRRLLWVLRTDLGLTGTKYGCGIGRCGCCTVVVNGRPARSCRTALSQIDGSEISTIEGLARDGTPHPLQAAFVEHGGYQCGYCTSGMIMSAYGLLQRNPNPTTEQIVSGMERNLCRCGAHPRIVAAIAAAAGATGGSHE